MQALAKQPTTGGFNAAPKLWLHSCAKNCQDYIDSERRHSRLREAGRYRFMQVNEMENSAVTDWGNHNLGSTIILASVHHPDDPVSPRMLSRNAKKLLQSGVLTISEFASTNHLSDLYFLQVTTWLTLLSLSNAIEPLVRRDLARGCKFKQRRHIYNQTPR